MAAELSWPLGTGREIVLCSHCFWQFIYSNETIHSSPGVHQTETVFSFGLHNKYTVFQHYGFTFNSVYPIQHAFALDPWIIYSWHCCFCYCTSLLVAVHSAQSCSLSLFIIQYPFLSESIALPNSIKQMLEKITFFIPLKENFIRYHFNFKLTQMRQAPLYFQLAKS